MIIAIHQPNYLPWLGYFHKMMSCDLFVILDDVIHSKRAITNKNKIKGPQGARLLSIPLANKEVLIKDVNTLDDGKWYYKHWKSLEACYTRAPYWKNYKDLFLPIYANPSVKLADLNLRIIQVIREILNINTPMVYSSDISGLTGKRGTRIINICKYFGADIYLSGTGARSYNDEKEFTKNNIRLVYQDFKHPVYPQVWGDFIPNMSSVDLIFNCGPKSKEYLTKQVIYE
ncbi:WbqC family protein [Desulfolucanica intricata]|uniref:WbqC family protein n=1 Tax=Desulfolucanica intricata TaxID=1285191 RepID=UPI0008347070|nr:WbqC family protein [Desulfolucanica intricata]